MTLFDNGDYEVTIKEIGELDLYRGVRGTYWRIQVDFEIKGEVARMWVYGFQDMATMFYALREHIIGRKVLLRNKQHTHPQDETMVSNGFSFREFLP